MSLPPAGQSALVYSLGVSTNDIISGLHGSGHYTLLTSDQFEQYLMQSFLWGAVPVGLGVLSLVAGIVYCTCSLKLFRRCRKICCKCCKKTKAKSSAEDDETARKKKVKRIRCQYIWMSAFSIFMLAFAIIGFVANGQFAATITGSGGALDITSDWFVELKAFCNDTRAPIQFIGKHVSNTIGLVVLPLLADTAMIDYGTLGLTMMLEEFSLNYSNRTITFDDGFNNETFDCAVCTTIADKVNATRDQIIIDTQPMFDELASTRTSLRVELAEQNESIVDICTSVDNLIAGAEDGVDILTDVYEDGLRPEISKWSNLRTLIFSCLFAFPLLPIILSAITIITKKTIFLTIQNGLTWCTCSMVSIILGAHLMITVALSDICELNDVVLTKGITHFDGMKDNTGADIIQACIDNTRLIEVFNMTDQLDFGDIIDFDFDFNTTSAFDLTSLADLKATIANSTTSTFNGKGDAALQNCNDLIAVADVKTPLLTRDNIQSASATTYYTSSGSERDQLDILISTAQTTLNMEESAEFEFLDLVLDMQFDMDVIVIYTDDLKNTTATIELRFDALEDEISPILVSSNILLDTRCGFIGTTYRRLDESICLKMAPSIAAMCLSMILVVLMLLPVCSIGVYLKGNLQKREDRNRTSVFAENEASRGTELAML